MIYPESELDSYYQSCLEIFQDATKCREMLTKKKSNKEEHKKENPKSADTKFYLREELKESLYSKNKLFVKKLLGEPEKVHLDSSGKEIFIYTTPISKKDISSEFDDEIRIIFFRNLVNRIQFFSNS
ncbi:MAG: hypothetical protein N3A69_10795, partial [Leptospiraceae bacterium]|nr:hypothetical protein [Leptospiraceae bacterium]